MANPEILVIGGSVRPQRIGPRVVAWVAGLGRRTIAADFEPIDLRDWPLPMDDEPGIPAQGHYVEEHSLAWSRKIAAADGIVFVTPQYNWGYPAPLKNAIDHLYAEWRDKPALIVSYGGHGGGKCAAQLRDVLAALKMQVVDAMPALVLAGEQIRANTGTIDPETAFAAHEQQVRDALDALGLLLAPPPTEAASGGGRVAPTDDRR